MADWVDQALIDEINAFLARHDMAAATFGREVLNDPAFVGSLPAGRDVKTRTRQKITDFIRSKDAELSASPAEDAA